MSHKVYSATGNTFIIFDGRDNLYSSRPSSYWSQEAIKSSVDGILFLEKASDNSDFFMKYLNKDGGIVAMCGNGIRAISLFARDELNIVSNKGSYTIQTVNSTYKVNLDCNIVTVAMSEFYDLNTIKVDDLYTNLNSLYINTGVPHCVFEVLDIEKINVEIIGRKIRNNPIFKNGVNINFYQVINETNVKIRTYERGVEAETLACGTGTMAAAYCCHIKNKLKSPLVFMARGGNLTVSWNNKIPPMNITGKVTND